MIEFSQDKMSALITDLIKFEKKGKTSDLPTVLPDDSVDRIVEVALKYPRKKSVYVVDSQKGLIGLITIRGLMRNLFSLYSKPEAHSRRIIHMITTETASEMMNKEIYFGRIGDTVEEVLHYMIKRAVYAIPIVDKDNILLHEISLRDILRFLNSGKK